MGRVKTKLAKRVTRQLMDLHQGEFSDGFDKNKQVVNKYAIVYSKKLRNIIAGYATRLAKKDKTSRKGPQQAE